jgi:GABA(A) receptor-associated protein
MEEFKKKPFDCRLKEAERLAYKYHDRVPILIQAGNARTPSTPSFKYLVPKTSSVAEFVGVIRKKTGVKPHQAIFVFINGSLPPSSKTMFEVYMEHREEDGFLYVTYTLENTFGN